MSDDKPAEEVQSVYLVTRVITTAHKTSVSIPMGAFDDKEGAENFQKRKGQEVHALMAMQLVSPDGEMLDMTLGGVMAGMGIAGVAHVRHGPVEITRGAGLIQVASAGSRILTPQGRPN